MIPTAIAAVYLLSGDLVQLLMAIGMLGSFESKDLNKLFYFWMVSFDFEDLLFSIFCLVVSSYVLFDWYKGDTQDTEFYVIIAMYVLSLIMSAWNTIEFIILISQFGEYFS